MSRKVEGTQRGGVRLTTKKLKTEKKNTGGERDTWKQLQLETEHASLAEPFRSGKVWNVLQLFGIVIGELFSLYQ